MRFDLGMYRLDRFTPADVTAEPFPHFFVRDAVDPATYAHLERHYPPLEFFVAGRRFGDNHKIHCSGARMQEGTGLAACWPELARNVMQPSTAAELLRIFRPHVERIFPDVAERFDRGDLRIGTRGDPQAEFGVEQQVTVHTPVRGAARAERGPHIKECAKLFVAMLFIPCEPDPDAGGDFVVCGPRPGCTPRFGKAQAVDAAETVEVARLPYVPNSMVVFMNTPSSIVYGRPRGSGSCPVRYAHFLVEAREPLFDITRTSDHDAHWRRLAQHLRDRVRRARGSHPGFVP